MKKRLKELAQWVNGTVVGDGEIEISGVAAIEVAQSGEITFIANPRYLPKLSQTHASAVIVSKEVTQADKSILCVTDPYLAFAKILTLFSHTPYQPKGIDPNTWVSPTATLGRDLTLYPFVYIGDHCSIGDRVTLYPGVYVGEDSSIGEDSILYPNVSIYSGTIIGKRVILHSGVVVGSDGFGYVKEGKKNVKIPQVGRVEIEDDVEIGANTTIDRGALEDTVIEDGVKLDNQIQVAHNVRIGAHSALAGCVGIAGSARIGRHCMLGGGVGVAGHLEIADRVQITGMSLVAQSITQPGAYSSGLTVEPNRLWNKISARLRRLDELFRRLAALEKKIN